MKKRPDQQKGRRRDRGRAIVDAGEELEQLERYIDELSSFLPLPFCIVNPSGIILNINQSFSDLTGYNDIEIVGEEADCLFENKREARTLEEKIFKGDSIKGQEMVLLKKDKTPITASVSGALRKDEEGNAIGYFLAFTDISELKKLQLQLEQKVESRTKMLQGKIKELERFNKLAVGRELRMVELKKEIKELKERLKNQ